MIKAGAGVSKINGCALVNCNQVALSFFLGRIIKGKCLRNKAELFQEPDMSAHKRNIGDLKEAFFLGLVLKPRLN